MLHVGIGPTHVNESLSSINVPSLGESTLKDRKREVRPQIEKLAKESCLESLESERNLWKEDNEKENVAIGASFDMGWQKRGKAQNVIFVVLPCLTVVEKKMQLYLFLLGMIIHPQ